jgi:WD40 repeat protein
MGNCLQTFVGHTAGVSSANFSPDSKQIISAIWAEVGTKNPSRMPNKSLQTITH